MMRTHTITGGGGTRLYAVEGGNPEGWPILFIHGFSQCALTWRRQMQSELETEFRLVAMDLRGHGLSEKPVGAYADGKLWADDVQGVIRSLDLERPVVVGWSYGGFIICDYLRYYGDHDLGGVNFVGAASSISPETAPEVLGDDFLALLPGLFADDATESVRALIEFTRACVHRELPREEEYMTIGYNALVTPAVRREMLSRTLDNADVLAQARRPFLITEGTRDRIVRTAVAEAHARMIPGATLSMYDDAGHAVFLDESERFNRELASFALMCAGRAAATA